ncbi:MAG: hypothetical protein M0033_02270 [Nitrospiraceae bacterium]|nr:hypothetical protein [Nitrospiraceae bacterium]
MRENKNLSRRASLIFWPVAYAAAFLFLFLVFRNKRAVLIMLSGTAFFHLAWAFLRWRYCWYSKFSPEKGARKLSMPPRWAIAAMVLLSLVTGGALTRLAFKGAQDNRMIWAFNEDEGHLADLYDQYVSQEKFDLGHDWGYTYGSMNIMAVTAAARALKPVMALDGRQCVILNRLLLALALLVAAWVCFYICLQFFSSAFLGVITAGLLLTNQKVIEMALLSNYPDIFHMAFFTLAVYFLAGMLKDFNIRDAFLAVIFASLGFSVKYMGLPLFPIIILAFRYRQGQYLAHGAPGRLRLDLALFSVFSLAAPLIMFFTVNPFYLIHLTDFISQMRIVMSLYANPASMNHLPGSGVVIPGLVDWLKVFTSGGAPDGFLLMLLLPALVLALISKAISTTEGKRRYPGDDFIIAGLLFIASWSVFVLWRSKFAFFHYFLPVMPAFYIISCSVPLYLSRLIERRNMKLLAAGAVFGGMLLATAVPLVQDIGSEAAGLPSFMVNSLGYASRDYTRESRFVLAYDLIKSTRSANSKVMKVGQWLKENCPDARSLVTDETVFYYPPFIKDIAYWNRQLDFEDLFRTMPDLLIVSDWFMDMYTTQYSKAELEAMPPVQREDFLKEREFYSFIKGKKEFLNYRLIKMFKADKGWYWKKIYIYKRIGPRTFQGMIESVSGPTINPSPNGNDIFFRNDFVMPFEVYLAAFPGNPVPGRFTINLKSPTALKGFGVEWYDAQNHPIKGTVEIYSNGSLVSREPLSVSSPDSAPYSWFDVNVKAGRIVFYITQFKGQQRLLLRRFFMKAQDK